MNSNECIHIAWQMNWNIQYGNEFNTVIIHVRFKVERVMQWVGGDLMAWHCAGQGKILGQSLWEFLVDKVALGQCFL